MTLFDQIKGMSATELAEFLDAYDGRFVSSARKYAYRNCIARGLTYEQVENMTDAEVIRNWLMQEANESEQK
jgi:hypothetical protein